MLTVLAHERQVQFYGSTDLKSWTHLSSFGPAGATDGIWEVPDLFELPIEDARETRWVLKVDVGYGAPNGGSGGQYFTGVFDGTRFTPDHPNAAPNWLDGGKDFYAALSWSDLPASDGRQVWLGWMNNWQYAKPMPTAPWRGSLTVPRSLSLRRDGNTLRLVQRPIHELETLRREHQSFRATRWTGSLELPFLALSLEVRLQVQLGSASEFGVDLGNIRLGYDTRTEELFVERGDSSFSPDFAGRHARVMPLVDDVLDLHVLIDTQSMEVFADGGALVFTELSSPRLPRSTLKLYSMNGETELISLDLWSLDL